MSSRKEELLAEIKQQYPDMPNKLSGLLKKYCDEDALLSVKETLRKDGNKFHFELENNEFIVNSGKSGTPFSVEVLSADGEKYVYAENDKNDTLSMVSSSNEGDIILLQNNNKTGQTRLIMHDGQDGAFLEAENGNIAWQHEDEKISINSEGMTYIDGYSTSKFTPQGGEAINIDEGLSLKWRISPEDSFTFDHVEFDTEALTGIDVYDYSEESPAFKEKLKKDVMKNVSVKVDIKDGVLRSVKQKGKDVQYELNYGKDETSYVTRKKNADGKSNESIKVTADKAEYRSRYEDNNGDIRNEYVTVYGELPWLDKASTGNEIVAVIETIEEGKLAEMEKMTARRDGDTIVYEFETSCKGHTSTQQVEQKNGEITSIKCFEDGELVENVYPNEKSATAKKAIQKLKSVGYCDSMPEFKAIKCTKNGDEIEYYSVEDVRAGGSLEDMLIEFRDVMSAGGKDLTASNDDDNCYYSGDYKKIKELQAANQLKKVLSLMDVQALNRQDIREMAQDGIVHGMDTKREKQIPIQNLKQKNICEIHHTVTDEGAQFYVLLNGKRHGADVVQKGSEVIKLSAYNKGEALDLSDNSVRVDTKGENETIEVSQFFNEKPYGVWCTLSGDSAKNVKIYDIDGNEIPVDNVTYVRSDYKGLKESLHNQIKNPEQNVTNLEQNATNPEQNAKKPEQTVELKILQGHWRDGR